ncbi:hypothetical protein GF406_04950 [candidate division KSB1 bacterium]|nr:hypothetical protein [candidate division KSB1 bacterium]
MIKKPTIFKIPRKPITILFTDIQDSTRYWDSHGDVKGRLMVDQHNRLLFPIIEKYRGRIIKTIGDAIMASFKKPCNAVRAAIAMQQILERERQQYGRTILNVRIGIHTGQAIVESNDIFGDMVNVAARVEGKARGSEILVSGNTARYCRRKEFNLSKKATVQLKGKSRKIVLYRCEWKKSASLIDDLQWQPHHPVTRDQKLRLILHSVFSLGLIYFLYLRYIRYFLADYLHISDLVFHAYNPFNYPWIAGIMIMFAVLVNYLIVDLKKKIPKWELRAYRGGFYFTLGFLLLYLPSETGLLDWQSLWQTPLWKSQQLFVTIMENNTNIRESPSLHSPLLFKADYGRVFVFQELHKGDQYDWNRIRLSEKKSGWIARIIPPRIGAAAKRLSLTHYFYFRFRDLYALLLGGLAFVWGYWSYKIHLI